jgi:hypothetical protein
LNFINIINTLGVNGHHVSGDLVSFFNIFYRSIENYKTKIIENKSSLNLPEIRKYNTSINNPNNNINLNVNANVNYNLNSNDNEKEKDNFITNSNNLKEATVQNIYDKLKENDYEIIKNSFFLAEEEILKHDYDSRLSGSTCILIFCIGNKLISANAGDSRSIMIVDNNKLPIAKNIISKIKLNMNKK